MKVFVGMVAFCSLMLVAHESTACNRCGLFGNRCKFVSHHVAVAPVAYNKPEIVVVQNNYPQPNGVAALAQQGNSVYGLQAAALHQYVDPAAVLNQAAELARAAGATAQLGLSGYNTTAQMQLNLQAQTSLPLVKSAAAAQVLNAAGLSHPQAITGPVSLSLLIVQDQATGAWKIVEGQPQSLQNEQKPPEPAPDRAEARASVLHAKCSQCHGVNLTEPKGDRYFDGGVALDCRDLVAALRAVKTDKMPKGSTLTPAEKGALMEELLSLVKEDPQ